MNSRNILIVAGEASGDRHAARVVAELHRTAENFVVWGIGGEHLRKVDVEILVDAAEMNVVGFVEVIRRYTFFRRVFDSIVEAARVRRPSVAVLVDYPGFNLRLAKALTSIGIPVVYYIAPQVWAWKEGRVDYLRRYVSDLVVVFPFEVEYFKRHGIAAHFWGHPLVESIEEYTNAASVTPYPTDTSKRTIVYLPGSRKEELHRHMPVIREMIGALADNYHHVIPRASTISSDVLLSYLDGLPVEIAESMDRAISNAHVAVVKSGTSTLEVALRQIPFTVIYRVAPLSYWLARLLIRIPFIAMPNVLMNRQVVREFIQSDVRADLLLEEVTRLESDTEYRTTMLNDLKEVSDSLGNRSPSRMVAELIAYKYLAG